MIEVLYTPEFIRKYKKLPAELQEEVISLIDEFRSISNHKKLKVHALKGELRGWQSFSVNYRFRIVFEWNKKKNIVYLHSVGDHSVYE